MARGDEAEAGRPEGTCPKLYYRHSDAVFRDRLQRAYLIALLACGNLQKSLAVIRCSRVFVEQHRVYAHGPRLVAACAFLYGRDYGRSEAGAIHEIPLPDPTNIGAEVKGRPDLKEVLRDLRGIAEEGVLRVGGGGPRVHRHGRRRGGTLTMRRLLPLLPAVLGAGAADGDGGVRTRDGGPYGGGIGCIPGREGGGAGGALGGGVGAAVRISLSNGR